MSAPKKRKSDVHIDVCAHDNVEHPHSKKEKHWFEENEPNNGENRRTSIFRGLFKKMKSSTTLKSTNKTASSSKFEAMANETQLSINSESSVTSAESSVASLVPNINKNAGLRTFVNRDSFTPVPPVEPESENFDMPITGSSKQEATARMEDSNSMSSRISIDTLESNQGNDEDSMSIGSASAFCTPSRNPIHRNGLRMSTRSVPDWEGGDMQPALFRSLCNSAVRRVPNSRSDGGQIPLRLSMRKSIHKRALNAKSMEDVPEEEALVSCSSHRLEVPIQEEEEEQFGGAKEFFATNVISPDDESIDEGQGSLSRLSTSSEAKKSVGSSSIGRKNSIFRKMFSGKHEGKERRMSEILTSDFPPVDAGAGAPRGRRASIVSFTNEFSFGVDSSSVNPSASISSLASNDSMQKPKMRKKIPSTSNLNLTQRLSSVFRRGSNSNSKDDDVFDTHRRNTLTGFASISSGIGSIASGISDSGYSTTSRQGHSISRSGSKRDDENKRERSRRLLERIFISDIPAGELLKLKMEQLKKKEQKTMNEQFETQLDESVLSTNSLQNEFLNFDAVAVDVNPDGTPFSHVASTIIDEEIQKTVRSEVLFRPDRCGSITDSEPELVFVCPEMSQSSQRGLNDSMCSSVIDSNSDLLRNVRSGLCKSIEEWKKISSSRESSTMLIYPMFCQSEAEWDSKATIDAIFLMLDGILQNARRWKPNGKCILAGLTVNNVRLLREKYEEVKLSVANTELDEPNSCIDDLDAQSITSNSTIFGNKV